MSSVTDSIGPSIASPQDLSPTAANSSANGASVKRRAPIACRRCRRMRSKCVHDRNPPCKSCKEANVPNECIFPSRGDTDADRQFRHPRQRADRKSSKSDLVKVKTEPAASPGLIHNAFADYRPPKVANEWELLPSLEVVIDGVLTFTKHFYQLGFIPKQMFIHRLKQNPESISAFLLLSMLCIAARFNKYFIKSYGDGLKAAAEYMQRAQRLALSELYMEPTIERCQAFYLLSIAEQGSGKSNTSYISAGISFRMAALMRLHREEAYSHITAKSPIEHRVRAESARRTFWMLHSQDNLHSGPYKPVSLAPNDITALLPCDEAEFSAGQIPAARAALEGTIPAIQDPALCSLQPRSLFASLIQAHNYWGIIARRILYNEKDYKPHDEDSDYSKLNRRLIEWEKNLPNDHTFGKILLGGYRHYEEDLAYLGLTGCTRLCHIVLRKAYLEEMIRHAHGNPANPEVRFYQQMATELFCNVRLLHEQVDAHFEHGTPVESLGSQMAVSRQMKSSVLGRCLTLQAFVIYTTGLLASYLCKFPQLDAHHVRNNLPAAQAEGRMIYNRALGILRAYQNTWPLADTWCNGLEKWYKDSNPKRISFQAGTMTDGKEPQPYVLDAVQPRISTPTYQNSVMKKFHPGRTTTQSPIDDQRSPILATEGEAPRLAPLQTQPSYVEPVCLPPLSQAQYASAQHPAQHPHQSLTPQVPLAPPSHEAPHHHQHGQHPFATQNAYPESGLDMLLEASNQQGPTAAAVGYPGAYYPTDYPSMPLNDGFDSNLQVLVDGGAQWTATDATTAIYNPYGFMPPHS
ncbi:hypothetical protein F5Y15DRAFT_231859 [Xylariaceae sp. FL0016]|nr:hypothetical protein F5Y15DRAFT_231859 [Xylariaceae sp. FL0016]